MTQLLALDQVSFSYGAVRVTNAVSFAVTAGEAVGIIGPNGAGKSTLLDLISGTKQASSGQAFVRGEDVTALGAAARMKLGIARSFQIPRPFVGMTVFENLLVGATQGGTTGERAVYDRCVDVLDTTGLSHLANEKAGALRLLDRKRLELARAIATSPSLLLLDEIAGGLTDMETGVLINVIRDINARGVTIVWIEHVVHALMAVISRLIVLDQGTLFLDGEPKAVLGSQKVREIYLGVPA